MTSHRETERHHIVVGIDYSELAESALELAMIAGNRLGSVELHAVAVADREGPALPDELTADVKQAFREECARTLETYVGRVAKELCLDVTIVPHVAFGNAKDRILELAKAVNAELIVVGTHGRRRMERLLLGSVAETVIREAPCPVLAVRQVGEPTSEAPAKPTSAPHRIGVAVDFSEGSRAALEQAARWARLFDAELLVLHVLEPAQFVSGDALGHLGQIEQPIEDYTRAHATERLEAFLGEVLGGARPKLRAEVHEGIVGDAVPRQIAQSGCDWLVVGTHGRRGWRRAVLGSVAESVLRRCACPVLAIRTESASL